MMIDPDRRRSLRITPKGSVALVVDDHAQRARLVNVGEGGLFARTDLAVPRRLLGCTAALEIRLDSPGAEWLRASGRIHRIQPDGVAIAFDALSPSVRLMIDEATTASRARARVLAVVLLDSDTERRSAMAAGFRASGCIIVEAATPLEAIVRLGESSFEPDVIAVADSYPIAIAQEMRAFVLRDHPRTKLITIGDEVFRPDGIANWLSSSNPDADLAHRIREQLVLPWVPRT